jgi:hypothetical protein
MKNSLIYCIFFGLLSATSMAGSNSFAKPDLFDLLDGKNYVSVTISLNLDSLINNRYNEEKIIGIFGFKSAAGKNLSFSVNINLRGKYRRRMCGFPPLKLNFNKSELSDNGLSKADEYKLVTHCLEGEEGDVNMVKEFLAYQFYQQISPLSYRSKLLKITYQDTKSVDKIVGMAILLEDKSSFEKRHDLSEMKDSFNLPRSNFDDNNFRTHGLFQYLIGNVDWSTAISKNMDIYKSKENGKMFIVPYDFDFSGFVNVSYAVPNKDYNQKKIRDRLLLEADESDSLYQSEIQKFIALKPSFIDLIKKQKGLEMDVKIDLENYIHSFYDNIGLGLTRSF